jgi:type VI secretion system secreted protein VgrG
MSQAVETTVTIDGQPVNQFSSLKLDQAIYAHHSFRLVCPVETDDGDTALLLKKPEKLMGAPIHIKVTTASRAATALFMGLVTQVETIRNNGHPGDVVISGFSPTILLDNGPHCKSWERESVKSIMNDVLKHFPDWLQYRIAPSNNETFYYTVQYKETAWQFIKRLAGTYGEWLFYDGQQLVLGKPQGNKVNLVYGTELSRFVMRMQLKPVDFGVMAHDYMRNEVYSNGGVEDLAANNGHNALAAFALEKSTRLFVTQPKYWHGHFVRNKRQVDDFMKAQAAIRSSDVLCLSGCSDQPGFQPGDTIVVKAPGKDQPAESNDEYNIISIEHCWDDVGNYSNEFLAIPASVKVPPIEPVKEPICEMQSAFVIDNHDEAELGRVRVKFHWMNGTERSPWLRVATPHAGNGKGLFMLPEMGEEVIVAFSGGNPTLPYIIGTVFHGKAKAAFGNAGNDIKAIQTRSGNKIIMNDEAGSILVEDKNGNNMKMDGNGTITVVSKSNMVYECGESKIEMKKDGTINITGNKITVVAKEEASIKSGQAAFTADGRHDEANMEGMKAVVSGTSKVEVTSNADAKINAATRVAVQGATITLN